MMTAVSPFFIIMGSIANAGNDTAAMITAALSRLNARNELVDSGAGVFNSSQRKLWA
jgi:hypothetical protein